MASFPNKVDVPVAVAHRSKFDLSGDNITTSDVFKVKPSFILECIPNDTVNVSSETLIRAQPLAAPTFGRFNHFNRWFWVPMRTLMQGWREFIEGSPFQPGGSEGSVIINNVPFFYHSDIVDMFARSCISSSNSYDWWCFVAQSGVTPDAEILVADAHVDLSGVSGAVACGSGWHYVPVKFTTEGRAFLDMLQNLGYNINFCDLNTTDDYKISALPLLAYLRVFMDFYASPQFISGLQHFFTCWGYTSIFTDISYFEEILYTYVPGFSNFDPDFFVSGWNNPIAPNESSVTPSVKIEDVTLPKQVAVARSMVTTDSWPSSSDKTPVVRNTSANSYPTNLTQYILNQLRATTNYALRNNIAGYKFWDRLKAEYGVVMDYKEKGTSLYIETFMTPIQISEVMSQADTSGAALGDYAGKALGYANGSQFEFNAGNEAGYLICISSIVPKVGYPQGIRRENLHLSRLDFYHPDYDQQGVQAIEVKELFNSQFVGRSLLYDITDPNEEFNLDANPKRIFAYTPRFSEYKRGFDVLSGDFRLNSRSSAGAIHSYHTYRMVANEYDGDLRQEYSGLVHDLNFVQGNNAQFDRVFANTNPDYDHFQLIHHHEVHAYRDMKSLSDSLFDDEQLEHDKKTDVDYGGSQFN